MGDSIKDNDNDKWKYTAQRGFFSHDDDRESWEFRATTRLSLGLLDKEYPTDANFDPKRQRTQWERFEHYMNELNTAVPENKQYKLFYIIRHGEGIHNVKEKQVGREEWDRHWSKLPGDGITTWADAELTPFGEKQAQDLATFWTKSFNEQKIPIPESIYSSPLRRCLRTTELAFAPLLEPNGALRPSIKENLRERLGIHTCDQRSNKSWIAYSYPFFDIELGFTEFDELWNPDVRETLEEHVVRKQRLLDDIFTNDKSPFIALTAHSGALMALFSATEWKKIPVAAGTVYPLLVLRENV